MLGLGKLARAAFGTSNDTKIKSIQPIVDKINSLEGHFEKLSDKDLIEKTNEFKERFKNCLLYTSPSPRDGHQSRMPSSA